MKKKEFTFKDTDGVELFTYKWFPKGDTKIKGVVQIAHGMAEYAGRYERFAEVLTKNGYIVYANDHRGHGRTAGDYENLGYLGENGFEWMLKDIKQLKGIINEENPDTPVFLLGHSMGSILAQRYISLYGREFKGVILSGTFGKQGVMLNIGIGIAKREMKKNGERAKCFTLNKMSFGSYNKAFKPNRTDFDWLSRDTQEVDKYANDPLCGGVCSTSFFYDFFRGARDTHKKENMMEIPKEMPIFIISGEQDPVGKNCKSVMWLLDEYKKLGLTDVSHKFYKGARHEILNEINRDEVVKDIIAWLDCH